MSFEFNVQIYRDNLPLKYENGTLFAMLTPKDYGRVITWVPVCMGMDKFPDFMEIFMSNVDEQMEVIKERLQKARQLLSFAGSESAMSSAMDDLEENIGRLIDVDFIIELSIRKFEAGLINSVLPVADEEKGIATKQRL